MFFSFDGIDGTGKSTQVALLVDWLRAQGKKVNLCRDPGSTPLGEAVRDLLLQRDEIPLARTTEMLLYMAARAQLVDEVICPALARGECVVSDRYLLANLAYQGYGGELGAEVVQKVGDVATGGRLPDLTFLLDLPAAVAESRRKRPPDRLEKRGTEWMERVRQGFLAEAQRMGDRVVVIDAARSIEVVAAAIQEAARARLDAP